MARGSTSSAEKADGAGAADTAPAPAPMASPPIPPTGEGATDEYGVAPETGAGAALLGAAGLAAGAFCGAGVGAEAGVETGVPDALPSGGMALLWLTGAGRLVLPTPLGAGEGAACAAALGAFALRLACRTGGFLSAGGVSASSGTNAGSLKRAPSSATCRGVTRVFQYRRPPPLCSHTSVRLLAPEAVCEGT